MQITRFEKNTLPFRYLGIPLVLEKLLLDSLINKINGWPRSTLSYAGKLIDSISTTRNGMLLVILHASSSLYY